MAEKERNDADGRPPRRRVRGPHGDLSMGTAGLDPLDLAAYLEGRLDGEARAAVEARLADSPDSLDLLVSTHEALEAGSTAAPESLVLRAVALAGAPRTGPLSIGGRRTWPAGLRLPRPETRRVLASRVLASRVLASRAVASRAVASRAVAFASLAAVFLLAGAAGFELGRAEAGYSAQIDGLLAREIGIAIEGSAEDLL